MSDFEFKTEEPAEETKETVSQLDTGLPEYSPEELEPIFDSILFEGKYSEEVSIGGKLKVTFQTRNGQDVRNVVMRLDQVKVNMGLTLESLRSLYNLVYSVVEFNGNDLSGAKFEERLERLEKLPSAVLGALIRKLVEFDLKVEAAVNHGEANF